MTDTLLSLAFLGPIGWQELAILAVIGVLIFGKRLPEVGRSIGKGIVEFKKGLAGIDEEVESQVEKERQKNLDANAGNTTSAKVDAPADAKAEPSA